MPIRGRLLSSYRQLWIFVGISILAVSAYALVHVEARYISPFIVLFSSAIGSMVSIPVAVQHRRIINAIGIISVSLFVVIFALNNRPPYPLLNLDNGPETPHVAWRIAEEMKHMGLKRGDKVASLKHSVASFPMEWARLARVSIVAEVFYSVQKPENRFWDASGEQQAAILKAFRASGIRAVVSDEKPTGDLVSGWKRIGTTKYYALFFDKKEVNGLYTGSSDE